MSPITPTEGFLTTDGKFFPNENEALAHQYAIDIQNEIQEFVGPTIGISSFQIMVAITEWEEKKKLKELQAK